MINRQTLEPLIQQELAEANKEHLPFASYHEGFAVILEELEETEEVLNDIKEELKKMWRSVRHDIPPNASADSIYNKSFALIAEAIQVGAMARKMQELIGRDKDD